MKHTIKALYGDMKPWGKVWLYTGIVTLIVAAAMSVDFGWSVSSKHALFLGCLSLVAAFLPDAARDQWKHESKPMGFILGLVAVPLLLIEFGSHAGYTAGLRGNNISEAKVQNTKYDDTRDQVADHRANLKMWQAQLAKLQADNAWAATVKADGLRSELATLKARIEEEKKGNRGRKAGCGKECERLQNEAVALEQKIATVEQASDLSKRIEATQRLVDASREKAANTAHKVSTVDHQNGFYAQTVALIRTGNIKVSETTEHTMNAAINVAMALAGTGLPALCFFVAGLYRNRREDDTTEQANHTGQTIHTIERIHGPERIIERPSAPSIVHITDAEGRKAMEVLDQALAKWRLKGAAA